MAGKILVSPKAMTDPSFGHTVVLIIRDSPKEIMGLVLNRKSNHMLDKVWAEVSGGTITKKTDQFLMLGGPCKGPLTMVHKKAEAGEIEILPGLYASITTENLISVANETEEFRVFTGYAGWMPGQLDGELALGRWHIIKGTAEWVISTQDDLSIWKDALKEVGTNFYESIGIPKGKIDLN